MMKHVILGTVLLSACVQARTLYWKKVQVDAFLDAGGKLAVTETQSIVFDGDWNGGERSFRVESGQSFSFHSLSRVTEKGEVSLSRGNLAVVDHYDWSGNALRWRSRLPTDPPFRNTLLTYRLKFTYANILVQRGSEIYLDHDFAFPNRSGDIDEFELHLKLDPKWEAIPELRESFSVKHLGPGHSFVIQRKLRWLGDGKAPSLLVDDTPTKRIVAVAAVLLIVFIFGLYVHREWKLGRFEPLLPVEAIDEKFLQHYVFKYLPEELGAAWDGEIGSEEVSALLIRLTAAKKIAIAPAPVKKEKYVFRLLVPLDQFPPHERTVIDQIFPKGITETSTDRLTKRFQKEQTMPWRDYFDALAERLNQFPELKKDNAPAASYVVASFLFLVGILVGGYGLTKTPTDSAVIYFGSFAATALLAMLGGGIAYSSRGRMDWRGLRVFGVFIGALVPMAMMILIGLEPNSNIYLYCGLLTIGAGVSIVIISLAKTDGGAVLLLARRRAASARRFFKRELKRPNPQLKDEWMAHIAALGLGSALDKWHRTYNRDGAISSSLASSSVSGSWTGGGGAFGGAGASTSWFDSVGSISSAGSSGSSGGSSGGGGGGGW